MDLIAHKNGDSLELAVYKPTKTGTGNPWHDARTGRFTDAPPGVKLIRGLSVLRETDGSTKAFIDQRMKHTGPDAMAVADAGKGNIQVLLFKEGRKVDDFTVAKNVKEATKQQESPGGKGAGGTGDTKADPIADQVGQAVVKEQQVSEMADALDALYPQDVVWDAKDLFSLARDKKAREKAEREKTEPEPTPPEPTPEREFTAPERITQRWLDSELPNLDAEQAKALIAQLRGRGWGDRPGSLTDRVYPKLSEDVRKELGLEENTGEPPEPPRPAGLEKPDEASFPVRIEYLRAYREWAAKWDRHLVDLMNQSITDRDLERERRIHEGITEHRNAVTPNISELNENAEQLGDLQNHALFYLDDPDWGPKLYITAANSSWWQAAENIDFKTLGLGSPSQTLPANTQIRKPTDALNKDRWLTVHAERDEIEEMLEDDPDKATLRQRLKSITREIDELRRLAPYSVDGEPFFTLDEAKADADELGHSVVDKEGAHVYTPPVNYDAAGLAEELRPYATEAEVKQLVGLRSETSVHESVNESRRQQAQEIERRIRRKMESAQPPVDVVEKVRSSRISSTAVADAFKKLRRYSSTGDRQWSRQYLAELVEAVRGDTRDDGSAMAAFTKVVIKNLPGLYGQASWDGEIRLAKDMMESALRQMKRTIDPGVIDRSTYQAFKVITHEALHISVTKYERSSRSSEYAREPGRFIEEALVESISRHLTKEMLLDAGVERIRATMGGYESSLGAEDPWREGSYPVEVEWLRKAFYNPLRDRIFESNPELSEPEIRTYAMAQLRNVLDGSSSVVVRLAMMDAILRSHGHEEGLQLDATDAGTRSLVRASPELIEFQSGDTRLPVGGSVPEAPKSEIEILNDRIDELEKAFMTNQAILDRGGYDENIETLQTEIEERLNPLYLRLVELGAPRDTIATDTGRERLTGRSDAQIDDGDEIDGPALTQTTEQKLKPFDVKKPTRIKEMVAKSWQVAKDVMFEFREHEHYDPEGRTEREAAKDVVVRRLVDRLKDNEAFNKQFSVDETVDFEELAVGDLVKIGSYFEPFRVFEISGTHYVFESRDLGFLEGTPEQFEQIYGMKRVQKGGFTMRSHSLTVGDKFVMSNEVWIVDDVERADAGPLSEIKVLTISNMVTGESRKYDMPEFPDSVTVGSNVEAGMLNKYMEWRHYDDPRHAMVNGLIATWASTSADHHELALAMQKAVADEMGVTPPERFTDRVEWMDAEELYNAHGEALRAFVRAMYEETQDALAKKGIDQLLLYRGMTLPTSVARPEGSGGASLRQGEVLLQPASSFSYTYGTTKPFARDSSNRSDDGVVIAVQVPRERVLASASTGWGCLEETEFVILGGTEGDTAWISATIQDHVPEEKDFWSKVSDFLEGKKAEFGAMKLQSLPQGVKYFKLASGPGASVSMQFYLVFDGWKRGDDTVFLHVNEELSSLEDLGSFADAIDEQGYLEWFGTSPNVIPMDESRVNPFLTIAEAYGYYMARLEDGVRPGDAEALAGLVNFLRENHYDDDEIEAYMMQLGSALHTWTPEKMRDFFQSLGIGKPASGVALPILAQALDAYLEAEVDEFDMADAFNNVNSDPDYADFTPENFAEVIFDRAMEAGWEPDFALDFVEHTLGLPIPPSVKEYLEFDPGSVAAEPSVDPFEQALASMNFDRGDYEAVINFFDELAMENNGLQNVEKWEAALKKRLIELDWDEEAIKNVFDYLGFG
jgi:hypothetical protein